MFLWIRYSVDLWIRGSLNPSFRESVLLGFGIFNTLAQLFCWRQYASQILGRILAQLEGGDTHWLGIVTYCHFHHHTVELAAQDYPYRWVLVRLPYLSVKCRKIETELTQVCRLETAQARCGLPPRHTGPQH